MFFKNGVNGWGSRTRTYACQNQNLVPYRLGDTPIFGMPAGIRTPDPRLRRAMLYPAELQTHIFLERVKGIGPSQLAWKARALPLSYTRILSYFILLKI